MLALQALVTALAVGNSPAPSMCQKCHHYDKPLGVNCYASAAEVTTAGAKPVAGKVGMPVGYDCMKLAFYSAPYTCNEAFEHHFSKVPDADGNCTGRRATSHAQAFAAQVFL